MEQITVTFQRQDGGAERTQNILLDAKLVTFREGMQTLLGLPDNPPCRIILERTGQELRDGLIVRDAGIREGDKLVLIPTRIANTTTASSSSGAFSQPQGQFSYSPTQSLVTYTLNLSPLGQNNETFDYSISLAEFHEDNPQQFFNQSNGKEKQKLADALQELLGREVNSREVEWIVGEWCEDIALGYRETPVDIEI
ncbi:MAG: hypothetical protein F6J92_39435 [Symploca sp. SIO1A3]|nr:hypothetical protein [Symploca sp. SIO1A3]